MSISPARIRFSVRERPTSRKPDSRDADKPRPHSRLPEDAPPRRTDTLLHSRTAILTLSRRTDTQLYSRRTDTLPHSRRTGTPRLSRQTGIFPVLRRRTGSLIRTLCRAALSPAEQFAIRVRLSPARRDPLRDLSRAVKFLVRRSSLTAEIPPPDRRITRPARQEMVGTQTPELRRITRTALIVRAVLRFPIRRTT